MNNAVFGKTMENLRKHREIKLLTTESRLNYFVSEPNYHTTKMTRITMNKPVYLGLLVLDLSKTVKYDFGMIM